MDIQGLCEGLACSQLFGASRSAGQEAGRSHSLLVGSPGAQRGRPSSREGVHAGTAGRSSSGERQSRPRRPMSGADTSTLQAHCSNLPAIPAAHPLHFKIIHPESQRKGGEEEQEQV